MLNELYMQLSVLVSSFPTPLPPLWEVLDAQNVL